MFQCPYFFFDVVYIHNGTEEKEEEMSWKDMFAFMGSLDTKGTSYKYEVALAGPALELHNCMAKLLAHPCSGPARATLPTACWRRRMKPLRLRPLSESSLYICILCKEVLGLKPWFSYWVPWDLLGQGVPGGT